jgi:hypothetical protein
VPRNPGVRQRPTGRPPLRRGDPSVSVHLRVPTSQYDAAYQRAARVGVSVPEFLRRASWAALRPRDDDGNEDQDD